MASFRHAADLPAAPARRRTIVGWALYDWANSAYTTVIITFVFAAYFAQGVVKDAELGTALWGSAASFAGLAIAILAPILGAVADKGGRRLPWVAAFTLLCVAASAGLWFVQPDPSFITLAIVLVVLGTLGFELAQVFYNALLPDIAPKAQIGRVSGWAWGTGYAGGLVCLAVALMLLVQPKPPLFGLDAAAAEPVRATALLVALWMAVFALPLFLWVPDRPGTGLGFGRAIRDGLAELARTVAAARRHALVFRFLIARMVYTEGINTLFAFGGIYAAGTFGMALEEILVFGIILNVTAGLGAAGFAWIDDRIGARATILVALAALILFGAALLVIESKLWFYILGSALGIFVGPAQAASRSLMAHLAPPPLRAEMFGLYALSGKISSFVGPALVAWITLAASSQRWGMSVIVVLMALGALLLLTVRPTRASGPHGSSGSP